MRDIIGFQTNDLAIMDTDIKRAENLLAVQLDSLAYAPDWGIDLKFFLSDQFVFQNEAFRSYILQRMAENNINVTSVLEIIETFCAKYIFNITQPDTTGALMR